MLFADKITKIVLVKKKNEHLNEILKSQISVFLKFSLIYMLLIIAQWVYFCAFFSAAEKVLLNLASRSNDGNIIPIMSIDNQYLVW